MRRLVNPPMLKAPFPWFGKKDTIAPLVWERFGEVKHYIEPFFGSGAVLLANPSPPPWETINDLDGFVSNFWRATKYAAEEVAEHADWPVSEIDMHARHEALVRARAWLTKMLIADPEWYDAKMAGWWVWGQSVWLGSGWCDAVKIGKSTSRKRPHLSSRQGVIVESNLALLLHLKQRLKQTRVLCGEWYRLLTASALYRASPIGVFLDPPYDNTRSRLYAVDDMQLYKDVGDWCLEYGDKPTMRICFAGYEGMFDPPNNWETVCWKARGGMKNGGSYVNANKTRERLWFSPNCLKP